MEASGLWWSLALLDGAVGAGIFVYGVRQRDWRSLACGVALNLLPMFAAGDAAMVGANAAVLGAYWLSMVYLA